MLKYNSLIKKYHENPEMEYIRRVESGEIKVNSLIKLAIERHLKELQAQDDVNYPYYYDAKIAQGIINFAHLIPDVSSGEYFELADFQKFTLSLIDGWRVKKNKSVRFKTVYFSMARSNGKTQLASIIALRDFLLGQPETSRMVGLLSNTNDQVLQLYNYVKLNWASLSTTHYFRKLATQVVANQIEMRIEATNSKLIKASAEGRTGLDGKHITTAIFDEYQYQKDRSFVNSVTSGQIKIPDARFIIISTAGVNPNVPMHDMYIRFSSGLADESINPESLFICYEQDEPETDIWKPETWIESNPLMEVSAVKEQLTDGIISERDNLIEAGNVNEFIVKNMNNWKNAKSDAIFQPQDIDKAIVDEFDVVGRDVYIGMDFSISSDDTAIAFVFPYDGNKFHIKQMSFIPTRVAGSIETKSKNDGINYIQAEKQGYARITKDIHGNINQDEVYQWLLDYVNDNRLVVKGIGYDAYNTRSFARSLEAYNTDWLLLPIRQGAKSLSEPTKFLIDEMVAGHITMLEDEILRKSLTNAVLTDKDNLLLIDKNKHTEKIDVVDALIDALYEGMFYFTDFTNVEDKDKSPFAGMTNEQINQHFSTDFSF